MKLDAIEALEKLVPPTIAYMEATRIRWDNHPPPPDDTAIKGSVAFRDDPRMPSHIYDGERWRQINWVGTML